MLANYRMRLMAHDLALLEGRTGAVETIYEFSDFGIDVDLAAPPAELILGSPDE